MRSPKITNVNQRAENVIIYINYAMLIIIRWVDWSVSKKWVTFSFFLFFFCRLLWRPRQLQYKTSCNNRAVGEKKNVNVLNWSYRFGPAIFTGIQSHSRTLYTGLMVCVFRTVQTCNRLLMWRISALSSTTCPDR